MTDRLSKAKRIFRAFWWGFTHPFATEDQHQAHAEKLAKEWLDAQFRMKEQS